MHEGRVGGAMPYVQRRIVVGWMGVFGVVGCTNPESPEGEDPGLRENLSFSGTVEWSDSAMPEDLAVVVGWTYFEDGSGEPTANAIYQRVGETHGTTFDVVLVGQPPMSEGALDTMLGMLSLFELDFELPMGSVSLESEHALTMLFAMRGLANEQFIQFTGSDDARDPTGYSCVGKQGSSVLPIDCSSIVMSAIPAHSPRP
jgi:hypothetical protein